MTARCRLPLYAVLDVDQEADTDAIERAYRGTVKEYHPDVFDHDAAQDLFVWATRAKSVLSDESRRKRYDRVGHARFIEGAGWTSSNCPASRAAAVYWSDGARERDNEEGSSSGSDTDGSSRDVTETSDSMGEASPRLDGQTPGGAARGDETGTGAAGGSAGAGAEATARSGAGATAGAAAQATAGSGAGATAESGRGRSTAGAARSRDTAAGGPRSGHGVASETQRGTGIGAGAQRGRTGEADGATAWTRSAATAGYGSAQRAEELYFRNIAQVDADRASGGAGWESRVAPVFGVLFTLGVLFGSFALILYAL